MKVLVLGAGGFLGSRVVAALQARGDIEIVAGTRAGSKRNAAPGVVAFPLDATDRASMQAALDGVSHVVNCVMAAPDVMHRGVDILLEAALQRNVRRVIQISSIAIYGQAEGWLDEASAPVGQLDAYARSKAESEGLVRRAVERGLDAVILRPGLIYGPGSAAWTLRIGRLLQQRRLGDLGANGDGYCNLIHVDDVAAAVVAALVNNDAQRQTFNLADPDPPRWNDYLKTFAAHLGVDPVPRLHPRWLRLETRVLAIPLKVADKLASAARLGTLPLPEAITPSLATVMRQEVRFRSDKTDALLRIRRLPWRQGVAQAATWVLERS